MNGVGRNGADLFFECSFCSGDGGYFGQLGGRSLVKTSCDKREVFHLECITRWLDSKQQSARTLDQRQCICRQPALPLIRIDGMRPLVDESPYCETLIFNACRTGDTAKLRMLLRQDETLANRAYHSVLTGHPEHLLAVAIKNEHTDLVRFLIDSRADVNAVEHNGETPLHIAARKRCTEVFQMLIGAGADINNVLRSAIREGDVALLGYLISTEPGQLALDNALHLAADNGHAGCLRPLIENGANLNAIDNNGDTALHLAACNGHTGCLRPLIENGANLNATNNNGETALRCAARKDQSDIVNALLKIEPSLAKEVDVFGRTALHLVAGQGHTKAIQTLLANAPFLAKEKDNGGRTALHTAARQGKTEAIQTLLTNAPSMAKEKDRFGETALHTAALHGKTEAIHTLLTMVPSLAKEKDKSGRTALELAIEHGRKGCQKVLEDFFGDFPGKI